MHCLSAMARICCLWSILSACQAVRRLSLESLELRAGLGTGTGTGGKTSHSVATSAAGSDLSDGANLGNSQHAQDAAGQGHEAAASVPMASSSPLPLHLHLMRSAVSTGRDALVSLQTQLLELGSQRRRLVGGSAGGTLLQILVFVAVLAGVVAGVVVCFGIPMRRSDQPSLLPRTATANRQQADMGMYVEGEDGDISDEERKEKKHVEPPQR